MLPLRYHLALFPRVRLNFLALVVFLGFHLPPALSLAQGELLHFRLLTKESQILTEIADPFGKTVTGALALGEGEARGRLSDLEGTMRIALKDFTIAVPTLLFFLRAGDQAEVKFRFVAEEIP